MTLGIFVGGKSSRMGGTPKGLLRARDTDEPLLARTARLGHELGFRVVLVGDATPYEGVLPQLARVQDSPAGVGPLGGLGGLLGSASDGVVLAVACDMPHLSRALLLRVAEEQPNADVLAARSTNGVWEPLCARYQPARVAVGLAAALACGERSFQALFARLHVRELLLSPAERGALHDWDCPEDLLT